MKKIETVKIKSDSKSGYALINKCDFDDDKHQLFEESKPKRRTAKAIEPKETDTEH